MNITFLDRHDGHKLLVVHLGIGMVGNAIHKRITSELHFSIRKNDNFSISWGSLGNCLDELTNRISRVCDNSIFDELHIIWSAGKAGFSSSENQCRDELKNYTALLTRLAQVFSVIQCQKYFHLISSAGGLHEGNGHTVDPNVVLPLRPYGRLKVRQEMQAQKVLKDFFVKIIRVSSVYSIHSFNKRLGLIGTLIKNNLHNKVTIVNGTESTLRDYIEDEEVAQIVLHQLLYPSQKKEIIYAISGIPRSILSIRYTIEKIIRRKSLLTFSDSTNGANITFHASLKPTYLVVNPIETNIKVAYLNYQKLS